MENLWPRVALGDIVTIKYGKGLRISELTDTGFLVYGANGIIGRYSKFTHQQSEVLVTCRGATCGTINRSQPYSFVTSNSLVLSPQDNNVITKDFLAWTLRADGLATAISGTAQEQITIENLRYVEILLPPLPIQRQIVARLDALTGHSTRARDHLDTIPTLVDRFRQSVLASAFSGELTADWRKKNPDVEPASVLLERIKVERREKWIENYAFDHTRRAAARAQKAGKAWTDADELAVLATKRKDAAKMYIEPEPVDAEKEGLPEIPDGWVWARLEEVFEWASGKSLVRSAQRGGVVAVYGGNGVAGFHSTANVHHPTVIIGRVGAHCGNTFISDEPAWVTDNAIFATIVPDSIELWFIRSQLEAHNLNRLAAGSGQPYLNQTMLNNIMISLPPVAEQQQIRRMICMQIKYTQIFDQRFSSELRLFQRLQNAITSQVFLES